MEEKSLIIIGGGIAGLSAGCYARMCGFRTRIFEMHKKKPGGLCTSWKRQGYTVNGCVHWLVGSGPASEFHAIWDDLGALDKMPVADYEEFCRVESATGEQVVFYTDPDRLARHWKELAPKDAAVIDEFAAAMRVFARFDPPIEKAQELMNLFDVVRLVVTRFPLLRTVNKWNRITLREYGQRFTHPLLRDAFPLLFLPDFPMTFMLMTFGWMQRKAAGYPVGGSLAFSRNIEKRFLDLGGEMTYLSRVENILTEHNRAVGVRLADGTVHRADYVISAADGHATIFDLLDGRYVDDVIRGYYAKLIPFPPLVFVALGVNRTFPDIPSAANGLSLALSEPLSVGGVQHRYLNLHIWNNDPTLAPEGKTALTVMLTTDFLYWEELRKDDERYKAEKERIADQVVAILDRRFPGLATQVEMRDVSSPTTFVRYTGNWQGSIEGWQVKPKTWSFGKAMRRTLPGLDNFWMAGHWVAPGGGLPVAAMSGRHAVQVLCARDRRPFRTQR